MIYPVEVHSKVEVIFAKVPPTCVISSTGPMFKTDMLSSTSTGFLPNPGLTWRLYRGPRSTLSVDEIDLANSFPVLCILRQIQRIRDKGGINVGG